jgi:DNA-binding IscR family transcriptional regulator
MTQITPKINQYALRSVFELARHQGQGPTKISHIADVQAIPARLPEVILQGNRRQSPTRAFQTKQGHRL